MEAQSKWLRTVTIANAVVACPLDFRRLQHIEPGNDVRRQYEGAIPDSGWLQR